MADELTNRARALEASDKARRQLLADVSHELMTPLTAMRGYIETLSMAALRLDTTTRERYMAIVEEETHRLERIIGDLLDLARLEGGGGTLRHEHVPVAGLFDRLASRHEAELTKRQIALTTRIEPGAEQVAGDPDRLEQALQNLVANALRHTPEAGTISVTAEAAADGVHLTVRDTGPGIPPEHLPLIFDRFYKADASRKAATGSGLGLSIVKAIIERHGGTITARNDNGAVFEIVLPSSQLLTDRESEVGHSSALLLTQFRLFYFELFKFSPWYLHCLRRRTICVFVRHAIACGAFVTSLIAAGAAAAQPPSPQTPPGQTPSYPQAPVVADSSMRLQVKPRDTMVFVDGYFAGIVDDFDGTFQRLHVDAGQHRVQLFLPGHRLYIQDLYLQPGNTLTVRHTMEPLGAGEHEPERPTGSPRAGARSARVRHRRQLRQAPPPGQQLPRTERWRSACNLRMVSC